MLSTETIVEMAREDAALQRRGELAQLVDIVREQRASVVLEVGTFKGGTLRAWCECAADDALLISVDLPGGEFGGGYMPHEMARIGGRRHGDQKVTLIQGDSHSFQVQAEVLAVLDGRSVDFLFIDGDHTFDGVSADFETYTPLVASGGIVALHDVVPYPEVPECQVDRFWRDVVLRRFPDAQTIRTDGDYAGCGIGVIRWPRVNRKATALLAAFDGLPAGALIVEIGCARFAREVPSDGWSTVHLARAAAEHGWRFQSVDIDDNAASVARDLLSSFDLDGDVWVDDGAEWLTACSAPIHGLYLDGSADPEEALKQYEAATLAPGAVVVVDDVQAIGDADFGKGDVLLERFAADGLVVEIVDTEPPRYQMAVAR